MNDEIFKKIRNIVAGHFEIEMSEVKSDSALIDDLYADSLDIVELSVEIEKEFDIVFSEKEIEKFITVQDIVDCVEQILYYQFCFDNNLG